MIKKIIDFSLVFSLMLFTAACSSDEEKSDDRQGSGSEQTSVESDSWTKVSGCLKETRGMFAETITVEASPNGQLYFKNGNAYFCCEHEKLTISPSLVGKVITISESETGAMANCTCPYDLECLVEGLSEGDYELVLLRNGAEMFRTSISYSSTLKQNIDF